jgi:hypothetical protein
LLWESHDYYPWNDTERRLVVEVCVILATIRLQNLHLWTHNFGTDLQIYSGFLPPQINGSANKQIRSKTRLSVIPRLVSHNPRSDLILFQSISQYSSLPKNKFIQPLCRHTASVETEKESGSKP